MATILPSLFPRHPKYWGLRKIAQEYAPGIQDKNVYGDPLGTLKPGDITDFVLQHHATTRNPRHPHYDLRIGTPQHNLFSWAVPGATMPAPGETKRPLIQTQLHTHQYGSFEGKIPHGYGEGTVDMADKGKAIITKVTPHSLHFTLGHTKVPTRYVLVHIGGRDGKMWQLIAKPEAKNITGVGRKPVYQTIEADDADEAIAQAQQMQEKIDGAHGILNVDPRGDVDIYSVNPGVRGPVRHTERLQAHGIRVSPKLKGSYRGEMYFTNKGKAIPFKDVSGILNRLPAKSIETQREQGLAPQMAMFGAVDGNLSEQQKKVKALLEELPESIFHAPTTATTPEEKAKLLESTRNGANPRTQEGVMLLGPGEKVRKLKHRKETTGYLTGTFPGTGKRKDAGGLTFVTERDNPRATQGRVGTGFTDQELKDIVANLPEHLGKPIRLTHQGQFESGLLRAPSFAGFETDKAASVLTRAQLRNLHTSIETARTPQETAHYMGLLAKHRASVAASKIPTTARGVQARYGKGVGYAEYQRLAEDSKYAAVKEAIIRRRGKGFVLLSHRGKVLGHHPSAASALRQVHAIQAH